MPGSLKLFITGLVALSASALLATSFVFVGHPGWVLGINQAIGIPLGESPEINVLAGVAFWTMVTLFASAMPVTMPRGTIVSTSFAPIVASMVLGGPVAAGWITAIGTTELRELRGRVPWYGTLANHAGIALPAIVGSVAIEFLGGLFGGAVGQFIATLVGASTTFVLNALVTSVIVSLRTNQEYRVVLLGDARGFSINFLALAPLGWLMAQIYSIPDGAGVWATLLFGLPVYTTRVAHHRFAEMRDMFTQTIGALAEAVDKRDPFTSKHSLNVRMIAVDIGREMRVSESELEALEWGGLLHDVGKIGVPDSVLLKQDRLTREERILMNAHPVKGAEIISPVTKLAPELPIIRHHHEWYNGSGYPDRLMGDEIPKLARILHVADAFEAMTAARPYRLKPLTNEQALAELRKFAGIQFDPVVVDAFVRTKWAVNVSDPGRAIEPKPVPLLPQAAGRMASASAAESTPRPDPV
jgi:putative nucleotidyltransferase with HDIG domain